MSFAIIRTGGKQFRVEKGAKVRVPSVKGEVGASVELDVLATADKIGAPLVEGATVTATVVDHGRDAKIVVLIPSTTIASSARRMRAIARSRVRAWTITLAIIES